MFGARFSGSVLKELVLICDEIGADYRNRVRGYLSDAIEVWFPERPIRNSIELLESLQDSVLRRQPDLLHISAGLGDAKAVCCGSSERLVPIEFYEANVRRILELVCERSTAEVIWGTIPPVDVSHFKYALEGDESEYDNETIMQYNEKAREIVNAFSVRFNDLYGAVKAASREDSIRPNGLRFEEAGIELLARKVEKAVRGCLS